MLIPCTTTCVRNAYDGSSSGYELRSIPVAMVQLLPTHPLGKSIQEFHSYATLQMDDQT